MSNVSLRLLQLRIVVRHSFREDAHGLAAFEHAVTSFKRLSHRAHGPGIIPEPIDGYYAAPRQQPFQRLDAEELHRGHEVHLAWH